jgi:hypothetical protein
MGGRILFPQTGDNLAHPLKVSVPTSLLLPQSPWAVLDPVTIHSCKGGWEIKYHIK